MKKIIVKSCLTCNYLIDYDDPPAHCRYLDKDIDIPDEERQKPSPDFIWEGCELEDQTYYEGLLNEASKLKDWLTKHFPHIKKEWDIYQETK